MVRDGYPVTSEPSETDPLLRRPATLPAPDDMTSTAADAPSFPEGGLRGWLTVLSAFCAQFVTFGYITSYGVYVTYYTEKLLHDRSLSEIAWIGSIQMWTQLSAMAVSGPLADRYGLHVSFPEHPLCSTPSAWLNISRRLLSGRVLHLS